MTKTKVAISIVAVLATTSAALARTPVPTEPYGTPAQQEQCVDNMEASLHGQSPFGRRGTAEEYQSRGLAEGMGFTEYDVLVGRCMNKFYHQYVRAHGGQVQ